MSKLKKFSLWGALGFMVIGAGLLLGAQYIMKYTNTTEFCVSCHAMSHPQAEWEGSSHFSNRKGIRAQCADCHIPHEGLHYVKAKFIALKDVWFTLTNKIPDQEAYEKHRAELAKHVWDEMKANDSLTCRSCHSFDAMVMSEQSPDAQKMHKFAQENNQTCIDCHKGLVHFLPEVDETTQNTGAADKPFDNQHQVLYSQSISTAHLANGAEIRLMPYAELTDWKDNGERITATVKGWQQEGANSLLYAQLGKRINVAVLDEETQSQLTLLQQVHDEVTDADWKEVSLVVNVPKSAVTSDVVSLNKMGNNLNETHCSGCHAAIEADHYTANQWIGVVNSMKDRTSMDDAQVRAVTIYLQRNAKDMKKD